MADVAGPSSNPAAAPEAQPAPEQPTAPEQPNTPIDIPPQQQAEQEEQEEHAPERPNTPAEPHVAAAPAPAPPVAAPAAAQPAAPDAPTPEEQRKNEILAKYRQRVKQIHATGRAKPDMVAYKELREELTPASTHGHPPGVRVGEVFNGKGELAILGIHKAILRGIDSSDKEMKGAYAIVLSGGYGDDADHGLFIKYTGEGGQKDGVQVTSQVFKAGNLALRRNQETGTPVRVCRGKLGPNKERQYVYEGLYNVVKHEQVASSNNAQVTVITFQLRAVEGEAAASTKVTTGIFKRALASQLLAGPRVAPAGPSTRRPSKRKRPPSRRQPGQGGRGGDSGEEEGEEGAESEDSGMEGVEAARESLQQQRDRLLEQIRSRPGLINEDLSGGQEPLPIPLFNDTPDAGVAPPAFEYTADYRLSPAAEAVAKASVEAFAKQRRELLPEAPMCGRRWMAFPKKHTRMYQPDGRLKSTQPMGVMECGPACASATCRHQGICSRGVRVPLEVFWTGPRGWGVRVAADVAVGTFMCCYVGAVITDSCAEQRRQEDAYLFSLDHYVILKSEIEAATAGEGEMDVDPAKMPALPAEHGEHLVVDAREVGNVARFINHSCAPNCILQTVLMREAQGALYYYTAMFTQADLAAGTELTYNYGYATGSVAGRNLNCYCGADVCSGRIL